MEQEWCVRCWVTACGRRIHALVAFKLRLDVVGVTLGGEVLGEHVARLDEFLKIGDNHLARLVQPRSKRQVTETIALIKGRDLPHESFETHEESIELHDRNRHCGDILECLSLDTLHDEEDNANDIAKPVRFVQEMLLFRFEDATMREHRRLERIRHVCRKRNVMR
jgi:hypothetical protein